MVVVVVVVVAPFDVAPFADASLDEPAAELPASFEHAAPSRPHVITRLTATVHVERDLGL